MVKSGQGYSQSLGEAAAGFFGPGPAPASEWCTSRAQEARGAEERLFLDASACFRIVQRSGVCRRSTLCWSTSALPRKLHFKRCKCSGIRSVMRLFLQLREAQALAQKLQAAVPAHYVGAEAEGVAGVSLRSESPRMPGETLLGCPCRVSGSSEVCRTSETWHLTPLQRRVLHATR